MQIGPAQVVLALVGASALIGFWRGWAREVVTCAIILGAVLFLDYGGGAALAQLGFIQLPVGGVSGLLLAAAVVVGYKVGSRFGPPVGSPSHRVAGLLPGAVSGGALVYYVTQHLAPGTQLALQGPTGTQARTDILLVLGFGLAALVVLLIGSAVAASGRAKRRAA